MTDYVALLRGINVGGIKVPMAELRAEFETLGFTDVSTVLATGNVRFAAAGTRPAVLRPIIEAALTERFGYEAFVLVYPRTAIRVAADAFPFVADRADWHCYVVFVSDTAIHAELRDATADLDPTVERGVAGDGVIYWEVRKKMTLTSAFGKTLGKARYQASTTNRNLRTVRSILA